MRRWGRVALVAALGAVPAGASGAEPISYVTSVTDTPVPLAESAFDWSGFYAGVFGTGFFSVDEAGLGLGVSLGVNAAFDFFLVGAEVNVIGARDASGGAFSGQLLGRGGVLVTDDLVAFGSAGFGTTLGEPGGDHVLVGGGLELALGEDVSVRGQYLYGIPFVGPGTQEVTIGASFHF